MQFHCSFNLFIFKERVEQFHLSLRRCWCSSRQTTDHKDNSVEYQFHSDTTEQSKEQWLIVILKRRQTPESAFNRSMLFSLWYKAQIRFHERRNNKRDSPPSHCGLSAVHHCINFRNWYCFFLSLLSNDWLLVLKRKFQLRESEVNGRLCVSFPSSAIATAECRCPHCRSMFHTKHSVFVLSQEEGCGFCLACSYIFFPWRCNRAARLRPHHLFSPFSFAVGSFPFSFPKLITLWWVLEVTRAFFDPLVFFWGKTVFGTNLQDGVGLCRRLQRLLQDTAGSHALRTTTPLVWLLVFTCDRNEGARSVARFPDMNQARTKVIPAGPLMCHPLFLAKKQWTMQPLCLQNF